MTATAVRWSWSSASRLALMGLAAGAAMGLLAPLVAMWMKQRQLTDVEVGTVTLLYYLGNVGGAPACAWLVRRIGLRGGGCGSTLVAVAAIAVLPLATTSVDFAVMRVVAGMANGGLVMLGQVALVTIAPESKRSAIAGGYALLFGVGTALGPLLNSVSSELGTHMAFTVGACCAAAGGLALVSLPSVAAGEVRRSNRLVALPRSVRIALHAGFGYGMAESVVLSLLPVRLLAKGVNPSSANGILSLFVIGSLMGTVPASSLADRVGRSRVLSICAALGVVLIVAFEYTSQLDVARYLAFGAGACIGPVYAIALSLIGDEKSGQDAFRQRATWFTVAFSMGCIAGPSSVTAMLLCGLNHLWLLPLLVTLASIPVHAFASNIWFAKSVGDPT